MALWKARGGSLNKDLEFRSWHCGRQGGGSLNKELGFRSWHSGRQGKGSLNKEFDFRSWHCGRQGGEVYHGIVQRQGGEVQIKT